MRETPQNTKFIYKRLSIYSYMFKLQSPSKYSPFDAIHLLSNFFHCWKQLLNSLTFMPFSVSAIFCFTSFTYWKMFPFEDFFHPRKQKSLKWDQMNKECGAGGSWNFWSKTANTQHAVSRWPHKSHILKWANALKESSNKIHWSQMQPLTTMPAGTLIQMGS